MTVVGAVQDRRLCRASEAALTQHRLTLIGGPAGELRIPASVLHEAVGALIDGARLATRFVVEGESQRKGARPAWLDAACDFEITSLSAGSAVIALEARPLQEIDAARFGTAAQGTLFGQSNAHIGEHTAIDLFGALLAILREAAPDEVVADRALMDGCARFARVSGSGFHGLRLDGLRGETSPLLLGAEDVPRIERLRDGTPPPQAARLTGTLDTVSASRPDVVLVLADGTRIPSRMDEHDLEPLRLLLGKEVVVSGMARFRPSGRLLALDVEAIDLAREADAVFRRAPSARAQRPGILSAARADASTFADVYGTWPGDETDAALLDGLRAIE